MVQSYKKKLTYASKLQEKFSFFSFYKQISMSKIILYKKKKKVNRFGALPLLQRSHPNYIASPSNVKHYGMICICFSHAQK